MQTVPLPRSAVHFTDAHDLTGYATRGGHPDEGMALLAEPPSCEPTSEDWEALGEMVEDQAVSMAQARTRRQIGEAIDYLKACIPGCHVYSVMQETRMDEFAGKREYKARYVAVVLLTARGDGPVADGDSAMGAAEAAIRKMLSGEAAA